MLLLDTVLRYGASQIPCQQIPAVVIDRPIGGQHTLVQSVDGVVGIGCVAGGGDLIQRRQVILRIACGAVGDGVAVGIIFAVRRVAVVLLDGAATDEGRLSLHLFPH